MIITMIRILFFLGGREVQPDPSIVKYDEDLTENNLYDDLPRVYCISSEI